MADQESKWSVDRKVPLALIASLFLFFIGQVVIEATYRAQTNARLEQLEKTDTARAASQHEDTITRNAQGERLTRVETQITNVLSSLARIEGLLSREPPPARR